MEKIINWCNNNSGFVDAIFSFVSLVSSIIAVVISSICNIKQKKFQLLEYRKSAYKDIKELLDEYERCFYFGHAVLYGFDKPIQKINNENERVKKFNMLFNKKYCNILKETLKYGKMFKKADNDIHTYVSILKRDNDYDVINKFRDFARIMFDDQYDPYDDYGKRYESEFTKFCKENEEFFEDRTYNFQILEEEYSKANHKYIEVKNKFDEIVQKHLRRI